jgi:predicted amidohydrolase
MTPGVHLVAAVQFEPVPGDVSANLARAEQLAFEAAAKGAQVVVLPELCMSGADLHDPRGASACAQTRDGDQTQHLLHVARRFGCYVVFGFVETYVGKLYDSVAVLGPSGLMGVAQKRNLAGADHHWAARGESQLPVVPTRLGRLGALIGRDSMNSWRRSRPFSVPGQPPFYGPGSVDVLCLPTCRDAASSGTPDAVWVDLAEETRANVIVASACGAAGAGGSCTIDRTLRVWNHGLSAGECVVGGAVLV